MYDNTHMVEVSDQIRRSRELPENIDEGQFCNPSFEGVFVLCVSAAILLYTQASYACRPRKRPPARTYAMR